MTKQISVGLLGASFGTGNLGVGALAAGAIKCVYNQWPDAQLFICDYAKEPATFKVAIASREIPVRLVNIRFSKRFYLSNNIALLLVLAVLLRAIPVRKLRDAVADGNMALREIWHSDFMASIAGGDSFSDIYGIPRLLYVALPQILVILLGKKLILLPQTLGPFRSSLSRWIAKFILRNADSIYTRDHQSLIEIDRVFAGCRLPKEVEVRYDLGFALEPSLPVRLKFADGDFTRKGSGLVGLNISGLLYMGGYSTNNMFGIKGNYQDLVRQIIRLLIAEKDASVLLIPHVLGSKEGSESDVLACNKVYEDLRDTYPGRIGMVYGDYDQSEVKYAIGRSDLFIGSRMHACLAAVSQCVPTVAIAYSDKFKGVVETAGNCASVADARTLGNDELLQFVARAYDERCATRKRLTSIIPQITAAAGALFSKSGSHFNPGAQHAVPDPSPRIAEVPINR